MYIGKISTLCHICGDVQVFIAFSTIILRTGAISMKAVIKTQAGILSRFVALLMYCLFGSLIIKIISYDYIGHG